MSLYLYGDDEKLAMSSRPDIQDVKKRNEAEIMASQDVVSVGIGIGVDGQPAIIVGLRRDNQETRSDLPEQLEGYQVIVEIVGSVRAQ